MFEIETEGAITKARPTITPIVSFTTRHAFKGVHKDILPTTSKSHVVYKCECCCEKQYVGKMTEVLLERIIQHMPNKLVEAGLAAAPKMGKKRLLNNKMPEREPCMSAE